MTLLTWTILYMIIGLLFSNMVRRSDPGTMSVTTILIMTIFWMPMMALYNIIPLDSAGKFLEKQKKDLNDDDRTIK